LMLGIVSQKTTRVVVLRMRETYSLRCRLVDHALALPGENNTLETVTCIMMVTAERYPRRHCLSVQSGREGTEGGLRRGDGVSIGESYDVERCLDVGHSHSGVS
jgi:hypothetical protein